MKPPDDTGIDPHDEAARRLARVGLRYTPGRRALVELLTGEAPLTIPEILQRAPSLTQSSAYRHIAELERAGVLRRLVTPSDHARVELAHPLTTHHHHLVCTDCGLVIDVELDSGLERAVQDALDRLARHHGFRGHRHDIDLHGHCARCDATAPPESREGPAGRDATGPPNRSAGPAGRDATAPPNRSGGP